MSLIYVTGAPGVGKTTLQKELLGLGYDARDLDDPVFGAPHNKATGKAVVFPDVSDRTPAWFDAHEWRLYSKEFERLGIEAKDKPIIILGVASTDSEILPVFDKIMYLNIDDALLSNRVRGRKENDYGHNEFELEEILTRKLKLDAKYQKPVFIQIDASKSLTEVTEQILSHI